MKLLLVIFLYLIKYSLQRRSPNDDHYVAAVVEFAQRDSCNCSQNADQYVKIIGEAANKSADIIVFPVDTLTGVCESVPIPINGKLKKNIIPADHPDKYDYALRTLSAAAKKYEIYVVVNVQEILDCRRPQKGEHCPEKRKYHFSTNIVFDRNGALIARTRKIHLFGEPFRTGNWSTDMGSFDTDFGVTFGIIVGFDIMYPVPQIELITQRKVTDVVISMEWYFKTPFVTALQTQQGFAGELNINLLGAGANAWDDYGIGGSGIFSGKAGTLVSIIKKVTSYCLLVTEVPKTPGMVKKKYPGPLEVNPEQQDGIITLQDTSLDSFLTQTLEPGYQEITLDYQDITCKFIVNMTLGRRNQYYRYRAVAFSGVKEVIMGSDVGVRTCSIIACSGDEIYTCGLRFSKYSRDSLGKFSELTVIGRVPTPVRDPVTKVSDSTFYATSLKTSLSPLQPDEMDSQKKVQAPDTVYTLSLKNYKAELYTFGFYGRKYPDDGKPRTTPFLKNTVTKMDTIEDAQRTFKYNP